jgi:21S rRNA (GM2251-2'-O)-methyltransferase
MSVTRRKDRRIYDEILSLAVEKRAVIHRVSKDRLNKLCGDRPHQGVVLKASSLNLIPIYDVIPIDSSSE